MSEIEETKTDKDLRLSAYYYGFATTDSFLINRILSAVACGGKAYHHTENWTEEIEPYEDVFRGKTIEDWIQNAANDAAATISTLTARVKELEEGLDKIENRLVSEVHHYEFLFEAGKGKHGEPGYVTDATWNSWSGFLSAARHFLDYVRRARALVQETVPGLTIQYKTDEDNG